MAEASASPAVWVQLTQAMVARELVEGLGLPERRAAERLGLVPSAVSQYLSGKRLGGRLSALEAHKSVRQLVRELAQELAVPGGPGADPTRRILDTAISIAEAVGTGPRGLGEPSPAELSDARERVAIRRALRRRIAGEQAAVAECMRLAQKSRDELTRAVFRQIASDSLRHAEIVASLATYLDRGVSRTRASGITREEVERLIAREQAAESTSVPSIGGTLGGVMRLLWESMAADERKHDELLDRLRSPEVLGTDRSEAIRTSRRAVRRPRRPRPPPRTPASAPGPSDPGRTPRPPRRRRPMGGRSGARRPRSPE